MKMHNISNFTAQEIKATAQQKLEVSARTRKLFMIFHASYGSLFTSKFSTGELNSEGSDKGMRAALLVWDRSLNNYEDDVIEKATKKIQLENLNFPPNLGHFIKKCEELKIQKANDDKAIKNPQIIRMIACAAPKITSRGDGLDNWRIKLARFYLGHKTRADDIRCAIKMIGEKEASAIKKQFSAAQA